MRGKGAVHRSRSRVTKAVFTVRFTEGLADRHRLPLEHVIRVLTELKGMIEEAGRRLQREHGAERVTGNFGLELEAGFKRGSVQANIVITRDVDVGVEAAAQVIRTVNQVAPAPARSKTPAMMGGVPRPLDVDPKLMARLNNIGKIQEIDKTKMKLELTNGHGRRLSAVFDRAAASAVAKYQEPTFSVDGVTLFGRLHELTDRMTETEEEGPYFLGELLRDGSDTWRVKFNARDKAKAASLWSKQVWVKGQAIYYKAASPRIVAVDFGPDEERDYEAAFDQIIGLHKDLYKADLQTLLAELRGGD